ncbi:P-II family nitrogen regulator [Nitrincola sp.]|uniref:P-II family nitrogen regulator n=1 Tax=Nitrincola sp. TaxID=1926584 RepID=UPI003A8E485C
MKFKLIMVFVDEDKANDTLDAARSAGATGATIINSARGQGLERIVGILGLEILDPRTVIMILAESRRADVILEAVSAAGHLDETLGSGIALMLDVEKALGVSEHIQTLEKNNPL